MTPPNAADTPPATTAASVRLVTISIGLLLLLAALDQTIVATALPTIVADLGGLDHLSWVVTAYILASTVSAPLYGKLGDLYGRRLMVFFSVALFLIGSTLCGLAQSMPFLIFSRTVQGLGGGGLFVLALAVVGDVIAPKDRGKVQGVFAAVFSLSSVIGPLMGGWFVQSFSWHWIFFINLPLGALAVIAFASSFAARAERVSHKIDWAGAAALTASLGALILVTSLGGHTIAWSSAEAIALCALAAGSMLAFVMIEQRAQEPILPLDLFRRNVFVVTNLLGFASGAAFFGALTFLPIYLQVAKGIAPTASGMLLIPMTLGIVITANVSGRYMGKTGRYRILPMMGTALITISGLLLTTLDQNTGNVAFGLFIVLFGFGMGFIFPVVITSVQNAVPREQLGAATAASVMFRQIGGSLAVAVFGAIFTSGLMAGSGGNPEINAQLLAQLPLDQRQAIAGTVADAIHPIYWIVVALGIIAFLFALMLKEIPLQNRLVPKGE